MINDARISLETFVFLSSNTVNRRGRESIPNISAITDAIATKAAAVVPTIQGRLVTLVKVEFAEAGIFMLAFVPSNLGKAWDRNLSAASARAVTFTCSASTELRAKGEILRRGLSDQAPDRFRLAL
jgi:hypothetical protein